MGPFLMGQWHDNSEVHEASPPLLSGANSVAYSLAPESQSSREGGPELSGEEGETVPSRTNQPFGGAVSVGARPEPELRKSPGQALRQKATAPGCECPGPGLLLVQGEAGGPALPCSATAVAATESLGRPCGFVTQPATRNQLCPGRKGVFRGPNICTWLNHTHRPKEPSLLPSLFPYLFIIFPEMNTCPPRESKARMSQKQ